MARTREIFDSGLKRSIVNLYENAGLCDGKLAIGYPTGCYHGVVEGALIPLFGVVAATLGQYLPDEEGFDIIEFEQAYFTDLGTGNVLDKWKNPYTGETATVPATRLPPQKTHIGRDLRFEASDPEPSEATLNHLVMPPQTVGGESFFTETISVFQSAAKDKPALRYNDSTIMRVISSTRKKRT